MEPLSIEHNQSTLFWFNCLCYCKLCAVDIFKNYVLCPVLMWNVSNLLVKYISWTIGIVYIVDTCVVRCGEIGRASCRERVLTDV